MCTLVFDQIAVNLFAAKFAGFIFLASSDALTTADAVVKIPMTF